MTLRPPGRPVIRGRLRLVAGRLAFRMLRYARWLQWRDILAMQRVSTRLPERVAAHQSLLMRKLHGVEMRIQRNKVTNLRLAIAALDGLVVAPGERFSLWYLVGNPSRSRGFKKGMVLVNGCVTEGYGGGLCQLSNLIYWMLLHSPLTVVERHRHSYDVFPDVRRKVPFGCGATVGYNYVDLQFTNPTERPYQLCLDLDDEWLKGELRSTARPPHRYQIYEAAHRIVGPVDEGYRRLNEIRRRVIDHKTGALLRDELVAENDALMMYHPLLSDDGAPTSFTE